MLPAAENNATVAAVGSRFAYSNKNKINEESKEESKQKNK